MKEERNKEKELAEMSDEELLETAKKAKSGAITAAVFIGFLIGIVIYSVAANTFGFFTLIPLYLAYRLIKAPNHGYDRKEVDAVLKQRNLK